MWSHIRDLVRCFRDLRANILFRSFAPCEKLTRNASRAKSPRRTFNIMNIHFSTSDFVRRGLFRVFRVFRVFRGYSLPRALLIFVLALTPLPALAQSPNPHEPEVRALWQRFENAFNAGDAAAIGELFTDGADRVNGSGAWMRGRAAIQQQYGQMLQRRSADPSAQPFHPAITIRFVRDDVALVDGEWKGKRGGTDVGGRFILIAIRNSDRWLFNAGRAWDYPLPD